MGTNYYLRAKAEWPGGDPALAEGVERLTNGWACNGTYYPDDESLKAGYSKTYHIGKSSAGWRFLLCSYPEDGLTDWPEWKRLIEAPGSEAFDEYGVKVSPEEIEGIVCHKPPCPALPESGTRESCGKDYEVRGGLMVHPVGRFVSANSPTCTYDVASGHDFS